MSDAELSKHDRVLVGLVISLQAAAMQHLGKIKDPVTDAVERDLAQARGTIDILEMLKEKCRTDTPAEVLRMLDTAVYGLQLNYLDEVKKDRAGEAKPEASGESGSPAEPAADQSSGASDDGSAVGDSE